MELCGVITKKGTPCQLPKCCPTHSLTTKQLIERNRKVGLQVNTAHLRTIGKLGFQALVRKYQNQGLTLAEAQFQAVNQAADKSAEKRKNNPSGPEQTMKDWLTKQGWEFEQEWRPLPNRLLSVDFVDHTRKICIEVTSFGKNWVEAERRHNSLEEKRQIVAALGYRLIFVRFN